MNPYFVLLCFCLIHTATLPLARATVDSDVYTTASGLKVSGSFVDSHTPSYSTHNPTLYEYVEETNTLIGPDGALFINLNALTEVTVIERNPNTVVRNGERISPAAEQAIVQKKTNGVFTATLIDGKLYSVKGPETILQRLDSNEYPNIFVNIYTRFIKVGDKTPQSSVTSRISFHNESLSLLSRKKEDNSVDIPQVASRQTCATGTKHWIELAIVFDSSLCQQNGNNFAETEAALRVMVAEANQRYTDVTCAELFVGYVEGFCDPATDPYGFRNADAGDNLDDFALYWQSNRKYVRRDTAHLFTGYEDNTNTAGVAYTPGTCGGTGYGYNEGIDSQVFAHELGHNLNCRHTDGGPGPGGLMLATVDRNQFFFNAQSIQQIATYFDSNSNSDCISATSTAQCDSTCPGTCTGSTCNRPTTPGPGLVGCSRVAADYRCGRPVPNVVSGRYYQPGACDTQYPFVLREYDANDASITCCRDFGTDYVTDYLALQSESGTGTLTITIQDAPNIVITNVVFPPDSYREIIRFNTEEVPSCALTQTQTPSPSVSPTPTSSTSPALSLSSSPSVSSIPSLSMSSAPSQSMSPSTSIIPTISSSPSVTASMSSNPSQSSSTGPSQSSSPSSSEIPTTSVSPSESLVPPSVTASPSQSAAPSLSSIPSVSATISLSSSPDPSSSPSNSIPMLPSTTASVSASASSNGNPAKVCQDFFNGRNGFQCSSIKAVVRASGRKALKVTIWVEFDALRVRIKGLRRNRISSYAFDFVTRGITATLPTPTTISPTRRKVITTSNSRISQFPANKKCCGAQAIRGSFTVNYCNINNQNCRNISFSLAIPNRCGKMCRRHRRRWTGVPMSPSRQCPGCVRS